MHRNTFVKYDIVSSRKNQVRYPDLGIKKNTARMDGIFLGGERGISLQLKLSLLHSLAKKCKHIFVSLITPHPLFAYVKDGVSVALLATIEIPRPNGRGISMAEREGFEPSEPVRAHLFSRQASSTTPAPLQLWTV